MPHRVIPRLPDAEIGARALRHLQAVVAIDSQSDERSTTVPTTEGQRVLAEWLSGFYADLGATVESDVHANVIATLPGRGEAATRPPVALLVHLDTARGTRAVPALHVVHAWDGKPIRYPKNPALRVDLATYPAAAAFAGEDVVHGDGDAPFGLDDKLGLAHLMTLATLLRDHPDASHPPLLLVGRPDEEVGRNEAIVALAALFADRGVRHAYTIDGILPFEINVENFNAAMARVTFADGPVALASSEWIARIGGVNTHGATAHAEGHRAAPRLVAEWSAAAPEMTVTGFVSDALRDCDALVRVAVPKGGEERVRAALAAVMEPHLPRGASWSFEPAADDAPPRTAAAASMIAWLQRFYASNPGFTLGCEDSEGRDGYTHPFRAAQTDAGLRLDLRIRDFDPAGLAARIDHVRALAPDAEIVQQYVNMGPRLAEHPELVTWAADAAASIGVTPRVTPIRGGTGVDPFLDRGVPVANLGTGYFSPESEKELTSLQTMARHARWLFALVQGVGE